MRRVFNGFNGLVLVAIVAMAAAPALAADSDLSSSLTGPASVETGGVGTYTIAYGNAGPDAATSAYCNLNFPAGVPDAIDLVTDEQATFITDSATDDGGNTPLLFISNGCDALLIQNQGPGDGTSATPLSNMGVGASHTFSVSTEFPMDPTILSGGLRIDEPADIAGDITNLGRGSCTDCTDIEGTCFGEPLALADLGSLPVELVDDGSADPTFGCNPFTVTPGSIALVDRGSCEFGDKVFNAEAGGAAGVIIANSNQCSSAPSSPDCTIGIGAGALGYLTSIPAVMVSLNVGNSIKDAMASGTVMVTLGGIPTTNALFSSQIFVSADTDSDPNGDNDDSFLTTAISGTVVEAPVADFSFAPESPAIDEMVQFTDMSTNEPTEWAWDFGDAKGTSTEQNPSYSYAAAGTYDVSLTATNSAGSDTMTKQITVTGGEIPLNDAYFVSAAAFASGAGGAFFQTDLEINNGGTDMMSYKLVWLPRDADNSDPAMTDMFTLGAGMSVRYTNVLSEAFGAADGALGAIAVFANTADALIMSRTYAIANGETFGQAIPGVYMGNLIMSGVKQRITFMTENDSFRSNLGFQNGTNMAMTVNYELFSADGTSLGVFSVDLPPWGNTQKNRVFRTFSPVDVGYVDVWTTDADASFYAYGSVLDNATDDPTTILPQ